MGREYEKKDIEKMGGYSDSTFNGKIRSMLDEAGMGHHARRLGVGRWANEDAPAGRSGQATRAQLRNVRETYIGNGGTPGTGNVDLVGSNQGTPGRGNVDLVGKWASENPGGRSGQATRSQRRDVRETLVSGKKNRGGGENPGGRSGQATRAQLRNVRETFIGGKKAANGGGGENPGGRSGQATRAQLRNVRETFIGSPQGQSPRAMLRTARETYIGRKLKHRRCRRDASVLLERILAIASGQKVAKHGRGKNRKPLAARTVPVRLLNKYLECWKDTFRTKFGRIAAESDVVAEKNRVVALIENAGGTLKGRVAVVGDWMSSAQKIAGYAVVKPFELAARMAVGTAKGAGRILWGGLRQAPKAGKDMFVDPVKGTFFKKKGNKMVPVPMQSIPPDYYSNTGVPRTALGPGGMIITPTTAAMAARIAQRKSLNAAQTRELTERIELARNRARLAQLEQAESTQVSALEQEAAEAEAEAAQSEADMNEMDAGNISGWKPSKKLTLMGNATEAKVTAQVIKAAGPFAKMAILASPWKAAVTAAAKIFADAKKDPKGKEKVAALKVAKEAGDPEAEKVLDVLKMGKKTTEELEAAKLAEKEMLKKTAEKEGTAPSVVGMLPSSETVIVAIPGAKMVYQKAKAGDKSMQKLVATCASILRGVEKGDAKSKARLAKAQAGAKAGDSRAQLAMAAMAVAAAGIREEKAAATSIAKKTVAYEVNRIDHALTQGRYILDKVSNFLSEATGAKDVIRGTALKIAMAS